MLTSLIMDSGYQVTDAGLHTATFLTRVHDRLLPTGLAHLADQYTPGPLRTAATAYQNAIDNPHPRHLSGIMTTTRVHTTRFDSKARLRRA